MYSGADTDTHTVRPDPHTPSGCGLLIGDGLTIGFGPNNYTLLASNMIDYTFTNSQSAPNDYAIFETHDPWALRSSRMPSLLPGIRLRFLRPHSWLDSTSAIIE